MGKERGLVVDVMAVNPVVVSVDSTLKDADTIIRSPSSPASRLSMATAFWSGSLDTRTWPRTATADQFPRPKGGSSKSSLAR